jgi:hypothetical protein
MPKLNEPNLEQFRIVAELLERQDEVLKQLEELERRVEVQINEANGSRDSFDPLDNADDDVPQQESNIKNAA